MWHSILLAGGSARRMGLETNKVLLPIGGVPAIRRSAEVLLRHSDGLTVVHRPEDREALEAALAGIPCAWCEGGATRQESVAHGLAALPEGCDCVLIHDGARCLVDDATVEAVQRSVLRWGTGVASTPVTDTVKRVNPDGLVLETPDRSALRAVQTPQGFRTELIRAAHAWAAAHGYQGTDDASLLEAMGQPVRLTEGSRRNLKLTTREDIGMAEGLLGGSLRIGMGYDVHRLVPGRDLILCGETVPHSLGLDGHSDADVAVHALMDAMLGALALGDIGQHFPDTDERYRGISSMRLLEAVRALLAEHGAAVENLDITIAAQKPKLASHIPQMRANLAAALRLPPGRVSVKATTTERLGFEGREEGISAQAVCLVRLG